jgi:hypothetical protein
VLELAQPADAMLCCLSFGNNFVILAEWREAGIRGGSRTTIRVPVYEEQIGAAAPAVGG